MIKINKRQKKIIYKPLIYAEFYLIFIAFLFWAGPIKWEIHNSYLFLCLIALYYVLFAVGFTLSIKSHDTSIEYCHSETIVLKFLNRIIILNFIILLFMVVRYIGLSSFSLSGIIESATQAMIDPGGAYKSNLANDTKYGGSLLTHIYVLLSPILYPILPLSLFYFGKLNKLNKILVILTIIFETLRWISIGTNKGIFDLFIMFSVIIFLKINIKLYHNKEKDSAKKKNSSINSTKFIVIILLLVLCVCYFGNNVSSRLSGTREVDLTNFEQIEGGGHYNPKSIISIVFPDRMQGVLYIFDSYLTQGYYATSIALSEPFTPMFGVGNSMFLIANLDSMLDINLLEYSYQKKLEKYGIDRFVNWHSFYTWVANDISFIGVIFIMFLLGYYFASLYKSILKFNNPIAICLFIMCVQLIFYIPANNQIFAQPISFMAFVFLTIFWILRKYRFRIGRLYLN